MYKVYEVNFVFMLTLNHSSELPDSRRMLFEKEKRQCGTQLVSTLGRVKNIGVSLYIRDRQDCASKTHYEYTVV